MTRRIRNDERGAAMMEFALIAPVLCLMIMGLFDLGHQMYVKALLQGAVQKAGRDSTLQTGPTSTAAIDQKVSDMVLKAIPGATLTFTRVNYSNFANIGTPEPFVDSNNNGARNAGECYQDINANGVWDNNSAQAGEGNASEAAVYTATVSYPRLFPLASLMAMFPGNGTQSTAATATSSTVLRNQPYAGQTNPAIICT